MRSYRIPRVAVAATSVLLVALGCGRQPAETADSDALVLTGATVIDGTGTAPRPDAVVVVRNERIEHVGDAATYRVPAEATVLDLRGRWILPGLIDMHAHLPSTEAQQRSVLRRLLAFGITTFRSPAARPGAGVEPRDKLVTGQLVGPRMFTAGRLLDGPSSGWDWAAVVQTEDDVRREVRAQAQRGVDFIKLYTGLGPDLVKAGIDEAHAQGLKVVGHLDRTSWAEAAEAGIDDLVHSGLGGPTWELASTEDIERLRSSWRVIDRTEVDFQGPRARALARTLLDNEVVVGPNLVLTEGMFWGDDPEAFGRLEPEIGPAWLMEPWMGQPNPITAGSSPEDYGRMQSAFPAVLAFVRLLYDAGVTLTAGSDLMNPWMTPGISLHRELELLHAAGIPTMDVLTIATRNAAIALDGVSDFGTIEVGKVADIIVLAEDPLLDIRNTRTIEWVLTRGQLLDPQGILRDAGP